METAVHTERSVSKADDKKSPRKTDFEIDVCKYADPFGLENPTGLDKEQPFRLSVKGYTRQSSYLVSQAGGYEASNLSANQSPSVYNHMQEGDEMDFLDEGMGGSYTKIPRSPELKSMGLFTESPPEKQTFFELIPTLQESRFEGKSPPHKTFKDPRDASLMIDTREQELGMARPKNDRRGITSPTSSFSSRGEGSIRVRNAGLHKIKEEASYQDDVSASEKFENSHMGIASARSFPQNSAKDSTFKRNELNKVGIENSVGSDEHSAHENETEMFSSVNPGRAVLLSARSAVIPNQSEADIAKWSQQKTAREDGKKPSFTSTDIALISAGELCNHKEIELDEESPEFYEAILPQRECNMKKKTYLTAIADTESGLIPKVNLAENQDQNIVDSKVDSQYKLTDKVVIQSMRNPPTDVGKLCNEVIQGTVGAKTSHQVYQKDRPNLELIKNRFLKQTNRMQTATAEFIKKGLLKTNQVPDEIIFQEGNNGEFRISRDLDQNSQPATKNSFQYSFNSSTGRQTHQSPLKLAGQSSGVQIHINNNHASNIIINTTTIQGSKVQEQVKNRQNSIGIDIIFVDEAAPVAEAPLSEQIVPKTTAPTAVEQNFKSHASPATEVGIEKNYLLQSVSKPHKKQPVKATNPSTIGGKKTANKPAAAISGANSLRRDSSNPGYKSLLAGSKVSKSTEHLSKVKQNKPFLELSEDLFTKKQVQAAAKNAQLSTQRTPKLKNPSPGMLLGTPEKTRYLPGLEEPVFSPTSKQSLSTGEFIRQQTLELSINTKTGASTEPWSLPKSREIISRKPQETSASKWIAPSSTNTRNAMTTKCDPKSSFVLPHEQTSTSWTQKLCRSEVSQGGIGQKGDNSHLAYSNEVTISSNWSNKAIYSMQLQKPKHKWTEQSSAGGLTSKKGSRCLMSPVFVGEQPQGRATADSGDGALLAQPLSPLGVGGKSKVPGASSRKPIHKTITQVASNSTINLFRDPTLFKPQFKQG